MTINQLIQAAKEFCVTEDNLYYANLYGVTDGKAIGTFVEHRFQDFLANNYSFQKGSSAKGLDLPLLNTDIKVTSIKQPQSSCPFKNSSQKIFGLGYNLILFVYNKIDCDSTKKGALNYLSCTFIDKSRTADYQTTTGIVNIINNNGNSDDIFAFLSNHNIPADDVTLANMAEEILKNPPQIGYLTISNALQWRLQYKRVVELSEEINGITNIVRYGSK
ncbi:MAG: restriction endonuclease [Bacteroidales bacterium]